MPPKKGSAAAAPAKGGKHAKGGKGGKGGDSSGKGATAHQSDRAKRRELAQSKKGTKAWRDETAQFRRQLGELGLVVRTINGDGNCLFRSIADQLYGVEERHEMLRERCCDHLAKERDFFSCFLLEEDGYADWDEYVAAMRKDREWGGNIELQALSQALGVNVVVHQVGQARWEITNNAHPLARCISVSYHDGDHYNSVRLMDDDTAGPAKPIDYSRLTSSGTFAAGLAGGGGSASGGKGGAPSAATNENIILASLPRANRPSRERVREALEECEGDIDACIEVLLAEMEAGLTGDDDGAAAAAPAPASASATRAATGGAGTSSVAASGTKSPAASASAPAAKAGVGSLWACSACSFENPHAAIACEMCEAPRPVTLVTGRGETSTPSGAAAAPTAAARSSPAAKAAPSAAAKATAAASPSASTGVISLTGEPPRRNGPCPCGSGKVFRRCCQDAYMAAKRKANVIAERDKAAADDDADKPHRKKGGKGKGGAADSDSDTEAMVASVSAVRI